MSHPLGWLPTEEQKIASVIKDAETTELLCTDFSYVKWCDHYGKQYGHPL